MSEDEVRQIRRKDAEEYSDIEELVIQVRPDLYRAFRRCVWMTIHETGMSPVEVHNMLIQELLKARGC